MKKLIFGVFSLAVFFIAGSTSVLAYDLYSPGSSLNPLQVQIQYNPSPLQQIEQNMRDQQLRIQQDLRDQQLRQQQDQRQENQNNSSLESQLKSQYGLINYYACYSTYESSCGVKVDMSNPSTAAGCLNSVRYCLESKSLSGSYYQKWDQTCKNDLGPYGKLGKVDDVNKKYSCTCQAGYILNQTNTSCVSATVQNVTVGNVLDGVCQKTLGVNSLYTNETDVSKGGGPGGCGCKAGYKLDDQKTSCVIATKQTPSGTTVADLQASLDSLDAQVTALNKNAPPAKTNDQACQDTYGPGGVWDGVKNEAGSLECDCKADYRWNPGRTKCVFVPKEERKIVASDSKSVSKIKNGDIKNNLIISTSSNNNVATVTRAVERKGFWSKVRGWLGF